MKVILLEELKGRGGEGDVIEAGSLKLAVLHTPGHAPDHICFALKGQRVVFSGDHVMAWNTTVIAPPEGRMSDYIDSLELLLKRRARLYLPGHGGRPHSVNMANMILRRR